MIKNLIIITETKNNSELVVVAGGQNGGLLPNHSWRGHSQWENKEE